MANYIKNEVLCEAYSRLNVDIGDDPVALDALKTEMKAFFAQRAKFLFGEDVSVEIEFEKGSLVTYLKVVGSAALVISTAMVNYGSFRQAVDYVVKDSTLLAQSANLEMVFRTKAAYCDRLRVEKRKGVFGRVDDLLTEFDHISHAVAESSMPRTAKAVAGFEKITTERLVEWNKKVEKLLAKVEHDETRVCIAAGLLEEFEKSLSSVPWRKDLNSASFRTAIATSDPNQAGLIEGAAVRYEKTFAAIKKNFETIVSLYTPKKA